MSVPLAGRTAACYRNPSTQSHLAVGPLCPYGHLYDRMKAGCSWTFLPSPRKMRVADQGGQQPAHMLAPPGLLSRGCDAPVRHKQRNWSHLRPKEVHNHNFY